MPIYEYKCQSCGAKFEELVSRSNEGSVDCPECSSSETQKQLSVFAGHMGSSSSQPACPSAGSCAGASSGCGGGACPMAG